MDLVTKVAVVGSREYPRLWEVRAYVETLDPTWYWVVSGGAPGVDSVAVDTAIANGIAWTVHKPDWNRHPKVGGFIRNKKIVDDADEVVAFWDGESNGTYNTIELTLKAKKKLTVFFPEEN